MFHIIIVYEKSTLRVISAVQINTVVSGANILKDSKYEVLITTNKEALYIVNEDLMYLKEEYVKK